jgi:branched-chain amino acid transport system substrate-binding protein
MDRAAVDHIPLIDGAVAHRVHRWPRVPYAFPLLLNYYGQASVGINYIAQREGAGQAQGQEDRHGLPRLRLRSRNPGRHAIAGRKVRLREHPDPGGRPGNEQFTQWRQVRQINPDWVFLRTWGVSTPVGIKTAVRFGIPVDRLIGDVWAGSEADVIPAGTAAKGYQALAPFPVATPLKFTAGSSSSSSIRARATSRTPVTSARSTTTSA